MQSQASEGKIAVILPVYNGDSPSRFRKALKSVFSQTECEPLIFVGIDGSINRGLEEVLNDYSSRIFSVTRNEQNQGLASTLNKLIEKCLQYQEIELIFRMDADDESLPRRLTSQIDFFSSHPNVAVLGMACIEVNETGKSLGTKVMPLAHEDLRRHFYKRSPFVHPTVAFRKEIFESGVRYPIAYDLCEDIALWGILLQRKYRFANLREPGLVFTNSAATLARRHTIRKGFNELKIRIDTWKNDDDSEWTDLIHLGLAFAFKILPKKVALKLYSKAMTETS